MVDKRITDFIGRHHVLTLASVAAGSSQPYCASCFYAYDRERNLFVFASDNETRHARDIAENERIACAIALETRIVGRIRGLQICGTAQRGDEQARKVYIKRFPFAAVAELNLWVAVPDFMKYTDNTLGFGKKLIWKKE